MRSSGVIKEVKLRPDGTREEFVCELLDRSATHAVLLYRIRQGRTVGDLTLPRGALTYGYFWAGRPYNVYHWVRANGRTLGYYVNLADGVQIRPGEVRWQDLAIDLLFSPDGSRVQILDEEDARRLSPAQQARVEAARAHVLTHRDEVLSEVAGLTAHLRRARRR